MHLRGFLNICALYQVKWFLNKKINKLQIKEKLIDIQFCPWTFHLNLTLELESGAGQAGLNIIMYSAGSLNSRRIKWLTQGYMGK